MQPEEQTALPQEASKKLGVELQRICPAIMYHLLCLKLQYRFGLESVEFII